MRNTYFYNVEMRENVSRKPVSFLRVRPNGG